MTRIRRRTTAALSAVLAVASFAFTSHDVGERIPATERLFVSAGCPSDTPGTCTSTRWLGTSTGDATSNFITAVTPVDEALYRADGSVNWRDYPADSSVGSYELTGEELTLTVTLSSAEGAAANVTVHARIRTRIDGKSTTLLSADQVVNLLPGQETPVTFTFDVAELGGAVLTKPNVDVAVHGVNVNAGHIDQEGGSTLEIPYLLPAEGA